MNIIEAMVLTPIFATVLYCSEGIEKLHCGTAYQERLREWPAEALTTCPDVYSWDKVPNPSWLKSGKISQIKAQIMIKIFKAHLVYR